VAQQWRNGLAEWGQDGSRIAAFRDAVDVALYTPGSTAGLQLKVLRSFAAPSAELLDDSEAFRERVISAVSSLLTLLGVHADPIRSREHILLSTILQRAWERGQDMDLATLIREIQSPPVDKIGVMDIESFFPAGDRLELSMGLNNLLASPGFASWMEGEPLQVPRLLWTPEGKPRISVLSIAHLSDTERMFFVTLLLNELIAWMRTQPGTSSLRALLYMDEVFGYFPPSANPPCKAPMLTLLKQARAYGLGVVLATQNPVDLDYKGLSNAGTWLLGRLQTERDKARVLDGLEGASAATGVAFDRQRTEATLAGLKSRVFLMNNVHEDEPVLFHTRWALSYLRGPLTRSQIRTLTGQRKPAAPQAAADPSRSVADEAPARAGSLAKPATDAKARAKAGERPVLPAGVPELYLPPVTAPSAGETLHYRPSLMGAAQLHFVRARQNVDLWEDVAVMAPLRGGASRNVWRGAEALEGGEPLLQPDGYPHARYDTLPSAATRAKSYAAWGKALAGHLYRERKLPLWRCRALKATSSSSESEGDFRVRLGQMVRERRDLQLAKLEKRYGTKLGRLKDRVRKAEERIAREKSQYGQQKLQTAISVGATMLGAMFGRKVASIGSVGRATTAVRGVGRAAREKGDVARAVRELEAQQKKLVEMETEFEAEVQAIRESADPTALELEELQIRPRKSDIAIDRIALVWTPWRVGADGVAEPAFDIAGPESTR
jgi:hypothetical protein